MIARHNECVYDPAEDAKMMHLLDLPDEILITVMSFLDFDTLLQAKLVCKHFDDLADQFVYESAQVLKGRQAVQLNAAFKGNPKRLNWVRSLLVSTKFGEDSGLTRIPPNLGEMRNLEVLRLETPDCNNRQPDERLDWIRLQDMYERVFKQSSLLASRSSPRCLPHLKECTLHFVDKNVELYSLTRYATIFLHPHLRSLTLSCASTDLPHRLAEALGDPQGLERSTSLEHLFLEECDIHAPSLEYLLQFPRALKSFKFTEGVRYDGLFRTGSRRMHGNVRPHHLMDALSRSSAETLESLSLMLGYRRHSTQNITDPGQCLNMTRMTRLKHIEVDNTTLQMIRSRPNCDHNTWLRLPPTLETLKVSSIRLPVHLPLENRREPHIPLETCLVKEKAKHGVPNLHTIIYSYEHADGVDEFTEDDFIAAIEDLPALNLVPNNNANVVPQLIPAILPLPVPGLQFGHAINAANNLPNPLHPPQPPIANGHLPPHITTNLNTVNPGNLNEAQQFLRQHWFQVNRARHPHAFRSQHDFSPLELSQITLLNTLNNELLPQYKQSDTRLQIDMVKLPRGFIPPYLYPEDKPTTHSAWWDSTKAQETEVYKRGFRLAREVRIFERNMREERDRRRREEELQELRRRLARDSNDDGFAPLAPSSTLDFPAAWSNVNAGGSAPYSLPNDEGNDEETTTDEEGDGGDQSFIVLGRNQLNAEDGEDEYVEDDDDNDDDDDDDDYSSDDEGPRDPLDALLSFASRITSSTHSSTRATAGSSGINRGARADDYAEESGEDTNFVDAQESPV